MSSSAAEQQLPSCIALRSKSNGKFLRYVHEHGEDKYSQLELSGEDALNIFTRFDVEPSRLHDGLVHIRSRYNRKYWVARRDQHGDDDAGDGWIVVAGADEPEEELSKPSCTLIKAVPVVSSSGDASRAATDDDAGAVTDDGGQARESVMTFRFVLAGRLQAASAGKDDDGSSGRMSLSGTGAVGSCLCVGRRQQKRVDDDGFTIFNLSNSKRLLPRVVAFKGSNGKYLTTRGITGNVGGSASPMTPHTSSSSAQIAEGEMVLFELAAKSQTTMILYSSSLSDQVRRTAREKDWTRSLESFAGENRGRWTKSGTKLR